MADRYRVVHERKTMWEALVSGRGYRDWYLAQCRCWWGWRTIGTFASVRDAETACGQHAGGTLLRGGGRIVSEFERKD